MKRLFIVGLTLLSLGAGCARSTVTTQSTSSPAMPSAPTVVLHEEVVKTTSTQGLYIVPEKTEIRLPGVLVIHEWWGLNDFVKDQARELARQGYAVFAISLYGDEVTTDPKRAGELAGSVRGTPDAAVAKMKAALDFLAARPEVASEKLASLGWCFGGGQSALIGASDARLKATVIYYGSPILDEKKLENMKQPVFGIWGVEDQSIPVKDVRALEASLKKQHTPVEFHYYDGAGHAFANPTRGDAYKPEATKDAWEKTLAFLKSAFKR